MASLSAASLLALSSLTCHLAASSAVLNLNLRAQPGDNVTLICQAPDVNIEAVEWSRTDLKELEPVFFYRDGHIDSVNQHRSFKNRVELKDKEMKNGDVSVILSNVKKNDSGTYECRFTADDAKRRKRAIIKTPPISTIRLEVSDPGEMAKQDEAEAPPDGPAGRGHADVSVHWWLFLLLLVLL